MSITTNGWGTSAISISGWGALFIEEYVASILALYMADSSAYSCVATRSYIEIQVRHKDQVLLRVSPDTIPKRLLTQIMQSRKEEIKTRGADQVYTRLYNQAQTRYKDDVSARSVSEDVEQRLVDQIIDRTKEDVEKRSAGWPRESGELCD